MVSSKFSQGFPPLRVPPVCKKKLEPPEEEGERNPDPNEFVRNNYDVDISWWIYHWVFFGQLILEKQYNHHWHSASEAPPDGEWASFDWFPALKTFSAGLLHYEGGVLCCSLTITNEPYPDEPNFTTGTFDYTSPPYIGKMEGSIFNFY